ncbi:uncharacterized protein Z518_02447 [Rhinocladiella mackenziei CBS 650.93]|uniref:Uncharacterized protein n=1 Tax=Rhinocladiella mackenziei CBS 650.93 TaxID=1442369 RepID=A0A0D2HBI7_9EURO|nr:uncharacterized protein Z518_02447 [Rhinocladiella mackenziei CBS 650.93]KIX07793.1 hypothetical protein Z518_02447 [Rhinocladiella mackenziei CBS 650.93]
MLLRGQRRPGLILVGVFLFGIVFSIYKIHNVDGFPPYVQKWAEGAFSSSERHRGQYFNSTWRNPTDATTTGSSQPEAMDMSTSHNILLSASTYDQRYFPITFGTYEAMNPNIIPHPQLHDTWVIVAQQRLEDSTSRPTEISCNAVFSEGALRCIEQPVALPIPATFGPHCRDDLAYLAFNYGPHDARVFYGPTTPYALYGSNSAYTCFGQWIQDFAILVDWEEQLGDWGFPVPTDLQRPLPYRPIEKNWFVFWDNHGQIYIHHDIYPQRVFARLNLDGSIGPDLAPLASTSDQLCAARYMPKAGDTLESIHQATNSLLITLCQRADSTCRPDTTNTYIMTIFQHKTFYSYHSVYEPYLMLFSQQAPFEIRAISRKPFWINGRGKPGENRPDYLPLKPTDPWNQTEMLYMTSMSWKAHGQKYHGYSDDQVFFAFGIEDKQTGGIDILAEDLMQDLGWCNLA